MKVNGAFAITFLRGELNLRVKVNGALASTFLRGEVDLRVQELRSSWWTRARLLRSRLFRSGNGTSRRSSRGGGEGKSWRAVVEVAAEVRLIIWPISGSLYTPGGWKSDKLVVCMGRGDQTQEPMEELKCLLGHRKVETHTMLLLVE